MIDTTPSDTLSQDRLRTLYQIIARMNSVYELPQLLAFILDRVLEHTSGLRGYLLLAQPGQKLPSLELATVRGAELEKVEAAKDILDLVSKTVIQDVLEQGEPRVIQDLRGDERYKDSAGMLSVMFKWRSILAIPLKTADRLIGLMYIEHPGHNAFPNPDLDFLSAFAGQAALVIDRAQQSQNRIEELERLSEISRSLVCVLDLDKVLTRILHEATHLLDVETGSVLLVEETGELVFRVSIQDGHPVSIPQRLSVGQGVAGWVASYGQPLLVNDVHVEPRWYGEVEQEFSTRSVLCVPLKKDEHVVGVVQVLNKKRPGGFTERDLSLLSALAASATVAIENANLFAKSRQVRELRAINEVATALGSTLELHQVLETGLAKALEVTPVEAGAVSLIDERSGELVMAATRGWRHNTVPVGTHIPTGQSLSGLVIATRQVLVTNDVQSDRRVAIKPFQDEGIKAMVMVPMRAGGEVVGVFSVMSYVPYTFTDDQIQLLSTLGGMFGVAVGNVRLYEKAHSNLIQLSYLNEVGGALTASLDLDHVLQIIMAGVTSLIGVERASIFLIDQYTRDLVVEYGYGTKHKESIRLRAPWPGIAGWITEHGQPVIANDVRHDPRFHAEIDTATHFETRSILGAPLKLDDQVIGVIEMLNKQNSPFTETDRDLLVGFSKWAAIALHNAQLYQELDDAKEHLATAEAVAVMSDMALNLTHRLNNRISVARVDAARIQAKCGEELSNPYLAEKVEQIRQVTTESLNIIRRIRQPFEMADLEPTDLPECLGKALNNFQIDPGIEVIWNNEPQMQPVLANPEKLVETLCHVIGNALDAMHEGGHLRLHIRQRPDRMIETIVSDDGTGISKEAQEHVFEPFFTTKGGEGRGLGLGLWLTRMYISRLGGQVKLESTAGTGTTVSIRLPVGSKKA